MWILCERGYRLRNFRGFLVYRGQRVACRLDTTMLLTVHSVCSDADPIIRLRKSPSATSTDAVESGRPSDTIGSEPRMLLPVPRVVNDCNAHLGVDFADQHRSTYKA